MARCEYRYSRALLLERLFFDRKRYDTGRVGRHILNRKLGMKEAPRKLLRQAGFRIEEMEESDRCCGFGGLFSVHMPEVSQAMTEEKLLQARQTKSAVLVSSDPGCLMQMKRTLGEDKSIQVKHIAEILEKVTA